MEREMERVSLVKYIFSKVAQLQQCVLRKGNKNMPAFRKELTPAQEVILKRVQEKKAGTADFRWSEYSEGFIEIDDHHGDYYDAE